jgi:Pyridoxamine 5'-phosphate oxidase
MLIQDMTREMSVDLLKRTHIGRLGCAQGLQPYVVPFSFPYHREIIYSFATIGKKIEWMRANPLICVEADEKDRDVVGAWLRQDAAAGRRAADIFSDFDQRDFIKAFLSLSAFSGSTGQRCAQAGACADGVRTIKQAKGVALAQDSGIRSVIACIRHRHSQNGPWKRQSEARASAGPVYSQPREEIFSTAPHRDPVLPSTKPFSPKQ